MELPKITGDFINWTFLTPIQGGRLNGKGWQYEEGKQPFSAPGPLKIMPEQLTDEVFDYVFDKMTPE